MAPIPECAHKFHCARALGALVLFAFCFDIAPTFGCEKPVPNPAEKESALAAQIEYRRLPSFAALFAKVKNSVVNVSAAHSLPLPEEALYPGTKAQLRREREILRALVRSLGSGFVFDDKGHVVTCGSIVQDAEQIEVILASGRHVEARLVGSDDLSDLAVLSIPAEAAPAPLPLGDSSALRAGDWVAAFGYPFGLSHSITAGMVSAIRSDKEMNSSHGLILSDAAINPGCNGGPLVDTAGKVVGINIIPGQLQGGMGLAIPIDDAKNLLAMLKQGNIPRRPWLGISVQYVTDKLARSFGLPDSMGALVSRVLPDSPGASAGIERGDIIITFAGRPVEDPQALIEAVRASATNRHVEMNVFRKGKRKKIQITPRETP